LLLFIIQIKFPKLNNSNQNNIKSKQEIAIKMKYLIDTFSKRWKLKNFVEELTNFFETETS